MPTSELSALLKIRLYIWVLTHGLYASIFENIVFTRCGLFKIKPFSSVSSFLELWGNPPSFSALSLEFIWDYSLSKVYNRAAYANELIIKRLIDSLQRHVLRSRVTIFIGMMVC